MDLSDIEDGDFHNGGAFANVGFTTGLFLPDLDRVFVGLHILLRVRINFHACGWFITRVEDLLQVRILI